MDTELPVAQTARPAARLQPVSPGPTDGATVGAARLDGRARLFPLEPGLHLLTVAGTGRGSRNAGLDLPATRISPVPREARAAVKIADGAGWLDAGGGSVVVKIAGPGGTVLVTTYGVAADAALPAVEIVRLGAAAAAPAEAARRRIAAELLLHLERDGDRWFAADGWAGDPDRRRPIEGFAVRPREVLAAGDLEYLACGPGGRRTPWVSDARLAGTRGRGQALTGFAIRLAPALRDRFEISYEGAFLSGATSGPCGNGDPCLPPSAGDPLTAIRLSIVERREPREAPSRPGAKAPPAAAPDAVPRDALRRDIAVIRDHFDLNHYLASYSDIKYGHETGQIDPLEHFCVFGWKEHRNPCPWFSVKFYLTCHHDVAERGENPFVHYIATGKAEGRRIAPAVQHGPRRLLVRPEAELVTDSQLLDLRRFPVRDRAAPGTGYDPKSLDIHWVIPDFDVGSGGHMTIFRMVQWLEIFGHRCTVWIHRNERHPVIATAREDILKSFRCIRAEIMALGDAFLAATGDIVVATGWQTVAPVLHATGFAETFYFVQDYEPNFYATSSLSLAAEATYRADLACICAGPWLGATMNSRYGKWSRHFWLAFDPLHYFSKPRPAASERSRRPARIAVYARTITARRAVELAFLALEELADRGIAFEAEFFGAELDVYEARFPCTLHGILDAAELGALYRAADIGVCFSATNYSIVPQEMMACGLPLVELDGDSTRAVFPDGVVTFCQPRPRDIADALAGLIASPELRRRQAERALRWVGQYSWEKSGRLVERAFFDRLRQRDRPRRRGRRSISTVPKVSVCIPTLNGGDLLLRVIDAVRHQRTPWKYEIVIVDSGSTDGSIAAMAAAEDIVFREIPKKQFGHGRTRNQMAELSSGEFVAYLTQDALPVDELWLYNLVTSLEAYPDAAGAFGRHIAWPQANPFVAEGLRRHFAGFLQLPLAVSRDTDRARWDRGDPDWRLTLAFYSDNNSCLRRAVWEKIPYPDIAFGEDQAWADNVISTGYGKLYVPSAVVFHSHDYSPRESYERSKTEAKFFMDHFGRDPYPGDEPFETRLRKMNAAATDFGNAHGIAKAWMTKRMADNEARLRGQLAARNTVPPRVTKSA